MRHINVRIDSTNPDLLSRVAALLRDIHAVGTVNAGHRHSTSICLFDNGSTAKDL